MMVLIKFAILFVLGVGLLIIITTILNDTVFKNWDPFLPFKKIFARFSRNNNLSVVERAKRANKKKHH